MKQSMRSSVLVALFALLLSACGGGGGSATPAPTPRTVTLSWLANHETGVNSAGGGYLVSISGQSAPIDVPFNAASGMTPTTVTTSLTAGTYTATVQAYAALDAAGGATGSRSLPSASVSIVVP